MRALARFQDFAYTTLRLAAGSMFAFHGAQKLFGVFGGFRPPLLSQMGLGGVIEFLGGLLIAAGLRCRAAAFLCSGTMAVAYIQFHWKGRGGADFFPAVNQGELALLYSFVFLYIACRGSGPAALSPD
jgi:putative oxidoreductase